MFDIVVGLAVFGIVYVAIIEIAEKCEQRHTDFEQEAHPQYEVAP